MNITNTGSLFTSRELTEDEYKKIREICNDSICVSIDLVDIHSEVTEICFDEYIDQNMEEAIKLMLKAGIPITDGEIRYWGDYEGKIYVRTNKNTGEVIIDTIDEQGIDLYEATDEKLIEILEERGYRVTKKNEAALEIPTSAGILKAFASQDPGQPGIVVMLQPAGYDCDIDMSYVSVYEDENYKTKDNERPVDVSIMTYGDIYTEDYTSKILIRREDVLKATPEETTEE